jgi:hypothetical protein
MGSSCLNLNSILTLCLSYFLVDLMKADTIVILRNAKNNMSGA